MSRNLTIGGVQAVFSADTRKFDTSVAGIDQQLGVMGKTAEIAATKIKGAGDVIDRTAAQQERAKERMRRAWEREQVEQDRAIAKEKELARARELAALQAEIEARSVEVLAKAKEREERIGKLGEGLQRAGELAGLALSAEIAVDGFKEMILKTVETGVELGHLSKQTGISAQDLSVLKYAAATTGVEFEVLQKGFKKLATEAYGASQGSRQALKAFSDLGISEAQLKERGDDLFAVLTLVADKFQSMPDGIQKNALATELFGKAGQQLIPILDQGAQHLEALKATAPIFSDEDLEKLEGIHRATVNLDTAWKNFSKSITVGVAPAVTNYLNSFAEGLEVIKEKAQAAWSWLSRIHFSMGAGSIPTFSLNAPAEPEGSEPRSALKRPLPGTPGDQGSGGASAETQAMTLNLAEIFNKDIEQQTKTRDANIEFYKELDAAQVKAFADIIAASNAQQAWIANFRFKAQKLDVVQEQPPVGSFQKLRDAIDSTALAFTDLSAHLARLFEQSVSSLNGEIARAMTGQRTNFSGSFRGISESAAKSGLEQLEGAVLKSFGFGSAKKVDFSKGNPGHVIIDGGQAGGGIGGLGGQGGGGLLGMLNDSDWASSLFGGKLFGAGGLFGAFSDGGPIPSGIPSLVGERGPELFMPSTSGHIIPNHKLGGMGRGGDTHYHIDARGTDPALVAEHTAHAIRIATARGATAGAHAVMEQSRRRPGR